MLSARVDSWTDEAGPRYWVCRRTSPRTRYASTPRWCFSKLVRVVQLSGEYRYRYVIPRVADTFAEARRTFKAVFSMPKMMPAPGLSTTEAAALQEPPEEDIDVAVDIDVEMGGGVKRQREQGEGEDAKSGPKKSKKQATAQAVMA